MRTPWHKQWCCFGVLWRRRQGFSRVLSLVLFGCFGVCGGGGDLCGGSRVLFWLWFVLFVAAAAIYAAAAGFCSGCGSGDGSYGGGG
jgi:hypothetical protein